MSFSLAFLPLGSGVLSSESNIPFSLGHRLSLAGVEGFQIII